MDSGFPINGNWITDSNRLRDSKLFQLYFKFHDSKAQDSGFHKVAIRHVDMHAQLPSKLKSSPKGYSNWRLACNHTLGLRI